MMLPRTALLLAVAGAWITFAVIPASAANLPVAVNGGGKHSKAGGSVGGPQKTASGTVGGKATPRH